MANLTCIEPECVNIKIQARGLCAKHYARHWSAGTLDEVALPPSKSRKLSDIDTAAKTVTCAIHGPGSGLLVRKRATKGGRSEHACRACRNEQRKHWKRGKSASGTPRTKGVRYPSDTLAYKRQYKYGLSPADGVGGPWSEGARDYRTRGPC